MNKEEINKCVNEILDSIFNKWGLNGCKCYHLDDDEEIEIENDLKDIIEKNFNANEN